MRAGIAIVLSCLRLSLAAGLVWLCGQHVPAMDAQAGLAGLPDYDYVVEAERLRAGERFSEALLVAEAGIAASGDGYAPRLLELKTRIEAERDDWMRRLSEVARGAATGSGDSVEALTGAVTADLFVFGDVRDLVIQGGHRLRGEQVDEVIVALSAVGVLLTAAPALDFGAALLKFARKLGALTESFARHVAELAREAYDQKRLEPLSAVAEDVAMLGRRARPAGAVAILRHIDDPAELRLAARFSQRPGGSFALWLGGEPGLSLLRQGAEGQALLLRAARKGRAGIDYAARHTKLLLQPHPLLGLAKTLYKGTLPELLARLLGPQAATLLGLLTGWLLFELALLAARLAAWLRPAAAAATQPAAPARRERQEPRL